MQTKSLDYILSLFNRHMPNIIESINTNSEKKLNDNNYNI